MEKRLTFNRNKEDQAHFANIKREVLKVVDQLPPQRERTARFRAILLISLYVGWYLMALWTRETSVLFFLFYFLMGCTSILIFLNVIHEAVHETLFTQKWQNQLVLYTFDLMGVNSFIWKKRHLIHHRFQNISGWDADIEQASLFRVFVHDEHKSFHTVQHRMMFVLYPLYLFNWIFVRDFKDFFSENRIIRKFLKIPRKELVKMILFKLIFVGYILGIPMLLGVSPLMVISAMLFMVISAGTIALFSLLTPHVNTTNHFPFPDEEHQIESSWLSHQFDSTNDVFANNWISRNVLGNFNYHLMHHIFPMISTVYAPEVTKVIKAYADSNGLGYRAYSIRQALYYHYQLIKQNSFPVDIWEETM